MLVVGHYPNRAFVTATAPGQPVEQFRITGGDRIKFRKLSGKLVQLYRAKSAEPTKVESGRPENIFEVFGRSTVKPEAPGTIHPQIRVSKVVRFSDRRAEQDEPEPVSRVRVTKPVKPQRAVKADRPIQRRSKRESCIRDKHVNGCCLSHPKCRWMRKLNPKHKVCNCPAYHFPHRINSGLCGHPERMWEVVTREIRKVG
jgi:hypothetical protein